MSSIFHHRPGTTAVSLLLLALGGPGIAAEQTLSPGADVVLAITNAAAGDIINLNPGNYGTADLSGVVKSGRVIVRSASGTQTASIYVKTSVSDSQTINAKLRNITFQNLTIQGVDVEAMADMSFIDNKFTGQCSVRTPRSVPNANILFDHNTFIDITAGLWEGRLTVRGYSNTQPVGVKITNNYFGNTPGSTADTDGVQIIGGAYGVEIGPGNEIANIRQVPGGAHTDPLQLYGSSHTIITGNYIHDCSSGMQIYPDADNGQITHNTIARLDSGQQAIAVGGWTAGLIAHNTSINHSITINDASSDRTTGTIVVRDNIGTGGINLQSGLGTVSNNQSSATFVGGSNPTTWAGFRLVAGSLGTNAATDGTDIGTNIFGPSPSTPDTAAPTVPTGLAASAVSATRINLSWTASTDNVGVSGYRVFRGSTQVGAPSGASYGDTGLTPSTSYSYTVRAVDAAGNVSAASTSVSATTQANHAPVATAQSVGVLLNTAQALTLAATDADGDALTYAIVANPAHGTLSAGTAAARTYTPTAGYSGADSFTFRATDSRGAVSNTVMVTIAITATETLWGNLTGSTIADEATVCELGTIFTPTVAGQVQGIRFYVATGESGAHAARLWDNASGTVIGGPYSFSVSAAGWYTYTLSTPVALGAGTAYTVAVSTGADAGRNYVVGSAALTAPGGNGAHLTYPANAGVFTTTVGARPTQSYQGLNYLRDIQFAPAGTANAAPVASAQSASTAEDTAKAITLAATDADGDTLTYAIVANPAHGILSGSGAARTYTPAANYSGADSFTFKANDGTVDSGVATVSITVTAVNDAPVATAQSVSTAQNTTKAIVLAGTDVEGSALTCAIISNPAHGTLSGSGASRTYTPTAGYSGADSFTFTVSDGVATSPAATVSITVTAAANGAPVVSAATATPSPVTAATASLAATASDDGGEAALVYTWSATGPAAVRFSPNGTNAAKASTATFSKAGSYALTVTAKDAGNQTGTRTVSVTVNSTVTTLSVSPTGASVRPGETVDFNATVRDQFGAALAAQPTLTWAVSGGGTISSGGLFTAGALAASPSGGTAAVTYVVTATGGGKSGTALVTVSTASTSVVGAGGGCGSGGAAGLMTGLGLMLMSLRRRR